MDSTVKELMLHSKMSERQNGLFLCALEENETKYYTNFAVGEFMDILKKAKIMVDELQDLGVSDQAYYALFYSLIAYKCNFKDDIFYSLIETTFFDTNFSNFVINMPPSNSGYLSFMQSLVPKIKELQSLMFEHKHYLVLKKYQEIIDLCNYQGINQNLSDEDKQNELSKKFDVVSQGYYLRNYNKMLSNPKLSKEEIFKKDHFVYAKNYYYEAIALQRVLYEIMHKYYEENQVFFRQYTDGIKMYFLKDLTIVTYKYDDTPNMALYHYYLTLTWKDRDFWAKIFDPDIDFIKDKNINYFIDRGSESQIFVVRALLFETEPFKSLGKKVIFTPEEYMDEALVKTMIGDEDFAESDKKRFESMGINPDNLTNKLMSGDNCFYFKDPTIVDELVLNKPEDYKYYNLIHDKKTSESRNRCIASIIANSKKNPKKSNRKNKQYQRHITEEEWQSIQQSNPDIILPHYFKHYSMEERLPYKDN